MASANQPTERQTVLAPIESTFSFGNSPESRKIDEGLPIDKNPLLKPARWYDGFVRLFYWYPSDLYSSKEKKLLFKLDIVILVYICASYFTKSLDKSNITNAYVTHMKEDIGFGGDALAYAKSLYSAGYIVSMCFGVMFVTRKWSRLMLPVLEIIWGVLTFCESACTTKQQMYALRFLIGLAEGPIFPSIAFTLGSWYNKSEIYRRVMCFSISSGIGGIFSGFLQSASFSHLSGKLGHSGWQWGFIIDGIVTLPIGVAGLFLFPGTLEQAETVWWLSKDEIALAKQRMNTSGVQRSGKLSFDIVKRVFLRWHVHYYTAFWVLLNVVALPDGTGFPLWLKSKSPQVYSISNVNNYPSIQATVGIVVQFLFAGLSDTFGPYPFLVVVMSLFIISYSSLAAWNIPDGYRWFCFMIVSLDGTLQAIVTGQINRSTRRDAEERAFVLGFSDAVSQAMNIWTNIVFFPTSHQPKFHLGYIISLVAAIIMLFLPIGSFFGDRWDEKHYPPIRAPSLSDSSEGEFEKTSINLKTPAVTGDPITNSTTTSIAGDNNSIIESSPQQRPNSTQQS